MPPLLPNSRSPRYHTFHLRALHLVFACFSLWTKHPLLHFTRILHENCPCLAHLSLARSRPFSCSVILHPIPNRLLPLLLPLSALRSKSAKPITATCRLSLIPCSLFLFARPFLFFCPYVYVLIDAYNRSALEGKMRQPWISFREPRSQIHLAQLSNDSHPANGPIPFCIGKPRLLYFPFLSPSLTCACAWSGVCHSVV